MGKLIRAATGFAIALTLLYGQGLWTLSPALSEVKRDIAGTRPEIGLSALVGEGTSALSARFGTEARQTRARRLHP